MLGAINGNPLNLAAINSEGAELIRVADLLVTQANATSSAAGTVALASSATLAQAAHTLSAAATNALAAAATYAQAAQVLSAAATAAIGSSLTAANDAHGFGGASTGAIAALLDALAAGDTLESTAEAEAIKAVLNYVQQAQTLSAAGTVANGAWADLLSDEHGMTGAAAAAVASMAELLDGDDTLDSLLRMLLAHRYGAGLARHGSTSPIVPHAQGSSLTVH